MASDLEKLAKAKGIKYFLISFTDLFGGQRSKLVPAQAINAMAKSGAGFAGFAGFATWLDMTPADSDMFVIPDPSSLIQLPWKPEVGWFAGDPAMSGDYYGYDGPCPPWNDDLLHHYHFRVYALDVETIGVSGRFNAAAALAAMQGHVLAEAELVGTYTLNAALRR